MRLETLLHTPPPVHVFAAGADSLLYGRHTRRRDALERLERQPMPAGWFQLGPVGLLHVERPALAAALAGLINRLDRKPARASLVVPNAWVRSLVVDVESLPSRQDEAEDVVRWRLKRVLPCRPEEVRLDFTPGGADGRLLVMLALDRPLGTVEDVFAAAGVHLGRVEPTAVALTALLPASPRPMFLLSLDERAMGLVLVGDGRPLLVRHKGLPAEPDRAEVFVLRELTRTLTHARGEGQVGETADVWLVSPRDRLATAVGSWGAAQTGVTVRMLGVDRGRIPGQVTGDDVQAWPLLAAAWAGEA